MTHMHPHGRYREERGVTLSAKKCLPSLMTEFPEGSFYMRQRETVKNGTCCAAGFPLPKGSFLQLCTGQKSFAKSPGLSEQKWQILCPPTLQLLFIDGIPFTSAPQAPKNESLSSLPARFFVVPTSFYGDPARLRFPEYCVLCK